MTDLQQIDAIPRLPPRPAAGHKGMFGRVLVLGGSESMFGAAVLAGTAALRAGSGLVQVALPRSAVPFSLSVTPELVSLPLSEGRPDRTRLVEAAERADVLVIGPGLGTSRLARARVRRLLELDKPAVVDADALNILAAEDAWPADVRARLVLTPHPGEMNRLAKLLDRPDGETGVPNDDEGRLAIAALAARTFGQVVLLKGTGTVVTDGARAYVNCTGDSSLSKAGTGDVLSGLIGSLIGQGLEPFDAACLGSWLHGRAGEVAGERLTPRCVLARDVIDALPAAMRAREEIVEA